MRAFQLDKSILLEGPVASGKQWLLRYMSEVTNNTLIRITVNEQTDIMDLYGKDVPRKSGGFEWQDGVILEGMKKGWWIVIDEANLANQQVLEGLNSVLDYRGKVFIPEIQEEVLKHEEFRLFVTQNPVSSGGGRKGLPASFLSRFSKIYIPEFTAEDLQIILQERFPELDGMQNVVQFAAKVAQITGRKYNLRDFIKVGEIYNEAQNIEVALKIVFVMRESLLNIQNSIVSMMEREFAEFIGKNDPKREEFEYNFVNYLIDYTLPITENEIIPLNFYKRFLYELSILIKLNKTILLTGSSGSGKTSLI